MSHFGTQCRSVVPLPPEVSPVETWLCQSHQPCLGGVCGVSVCVCVFVWRQSDISNHFKEMSSHFHFARSYFT